MTMTPPTPAPAASPTPRPRSPKRKRARRWPWALLLLAVLAAGGWWGVHRFTASSATQTAAPAELVAVERGQVEKTVTSSASVVSNMDVDIKCRASGEIIKLPFDISQTVHKGDLLCQLDPTDSALAVRSAQATVAQSTARLAQATHDLEEAQASLATTRRKDEAALTAAQIRATNLRAKADRQQQLLDKQLGAREDWETAQSDAAAAENDLAAAQVALDELKQLELQVAYKHDAVQIAQAQLQVDQINLDVQKQQLGYATVTAPVDGVVSALNVQMGTIVASGTSGFSGGTTIMTLSDLSRVFAMATVDESDIGGVRVGQPVRVTVASFPDRTFAGQVVRIATTGVNTSNVVTFEVKVEVLDEHKDLLRPQMTGTVTIIQEQRSGVLNLPASAVQHQGRETVVTLADGTPHAVTLGLEGAETVEITTGLTEGDQVQVLTAELPTRWKSQSHGPPGP